MITIPTGAIRIAPYSAPAVLGATPEQTTDKSTTIGRMCISCGSVEENGLLPCDH